MSQQASTVNLCSEGSAAAARQNELPAGGDLVEHPSGNSKATAQSASETNEDSSSESEGFLGFRSHGSSSEASENEDSDAFAGAVSPLAGLPKANEGGSGDAESAITNARGVRAHPGGNIPAHKKAKVGAGPAASGGNRVVKGGSPAPGKKTSLNSPEWDALGMYDTDHVYTVRPQFVVSDTPMQKSSHTGLLSNSFLPDSFLPGAGESPLTTRYHRCLRHQRQPCLLVRAGTVTQEGGAAHPRALVVADPASPKPLSLGLGNPAGGDDRVRRRSNGVAGPRP